MAKLVSLFFLHLLVLFISLHFSHVSPTHVSLRHVDSYGSFSRHERILRAVNRTASRYTSIKSTLAATSPTLNGQSQVIWAGASYIMDLSVGMPPVQLESIMDTGSDLIWTQCKPCTHCFTQATPIFDPAKSSSYSVLSCSHPSCIYLEFFSNTRCASSKCQYTYQYADGSHTTGILARETFTFGSSDPSVSVSVPDMVFGCSRDSTTDFSNSSGIVGLAMGNLSLVQYLDSPRFSYCLTPFFDSSSSTLLLGSGACINPTNENVTSTPIVTNPVAPMLYYMKLNGISIGGDLLSIPNDTFDIKKNGSGGMIIDSGSTLTGLISSAYVEVREKVRSIVNLPVSSDTIDESIDLCFASNTIPNYLPDMIFHFEGGDLSIPKENYMLAEPSSGLLCLAMMEFSSQSILGAYQQQNIHVLYDIDKMMLSFEPDECSKVRDMNCKGTKGLNKGSGSFHFSPASLIFSIFIAFLTMLLI
ncbi:hypothetical protein LUZ60_010689 [Juncus effusus]|nr:hypothetical protein LUZ60_010689 [Juncus effusus]